MGIITLILSLLLGLLTLAPTRSIQTPVIVDVASAPVQVTADATVVATPEVVESTPAATPDTAGSAPYLSEIYTLLDLGRGIFLPGEWKASAEEQNARTTLTYRSAGDSSLVYLEYLHFPEMTSAFTVPDYVTSEYFDIVLSTFPDHKKLAECVKDGLYLYQFSGTYNGAVYDIRYWARIAAPQRLLTVSMDFERSTEDIDDYARALFPTLPSCG